MHTSRSALIGILFIASWPARSRAQDFVTGANTAAALLKSSGEALSAVASGVQQAVCTVVFIADEATRRREKERLTSIGADLARFEADKWRLTDKLRQYKDVPDPARWAAIRVSLIDLTPRSRSLYEKVSVEDAFLALVPAAAVDLLRGLDQKNEFIRQLRATKRPESPNELAALDSLAKYALVEVRALGSASEAITAYIVARTEKRPESCGS